MSGPENPTRYDEVWSSVATALEHNTIPWHRLDDYHQKAIILAVAEKEYHVWAHSGAEWLNVGNSLDVMHASETIFRVLEDCHRPHGDPTVMTRPMLVHQPVQVDEDAVWTRQAWQVQVYVAHGYFEYEVYRMEQALEHAEVIMRGGTYRRSTEAGDVEVYRALKVKVKGPGLKSEYLDTFKRT